MISYENLEYFFKNNIVINKNIFPENELSFEKYLNVLSKPKSLFKYFSDEEYNIDSILKDTIYCNNPKYFNDPYDCCFTELDFDTYKRDRIMFFLKHIIQIDETFENYNIKYLINILASNLCENNLKFKEYSNDEGISLQLQNFELTLKIEAIEELKIGINDPSKFWNKVIDKFLEKEINSHFISCFSTSNDNLLLWAHYANKHTGYCVEYDLENTDNIFPVIYSLNKKKNSEILNKYFSNISKYSGDLYINFLLRKSYHWMYENEWRLILNETKGEKCGNGILVKFNPIKALYFGTKMSEERKRKLYSKFKGRNIKFYNMIMSENDYKMYFNKYEG